MARAARYLAVAACLAVGAACSGDQEPNDAAIREAIERMHRDWTASMRRDVKSQVPEFYRRLPNIDLAGEARFAFTISSARKVDCKRGGDSRIGYICRAVVAAGRQPVIQNIEGRFIHPSDGWQVRDLTVVSVGG